jgi:hypothetical protein
MFITFLNFINFYKFFKKLFFGKNKKIIFIMFIRGVCVIDLIKGIGNKLKILFIFAGIIVYLSSLINLGTAAPAGASLTYITRDNGSTVAAQGQQHPGGTIVTLSIDAVQQDSGWKAYIGNITGRLVLRNSDSQSIYEWYLDESTLSGNIFVSRDNAVSWADIQCANSSIIASEQSFLGILDSASDSINSTFNASLHSSMLISGIGSILADSCQSTATYVNGTAQTVNSDASFQEILLADSDTLIYGAFINMNAQGFDNNESQDRTRDFQLIVAENKTSQTGTTYYFYADISG